MAKLRLPRKWTIAAGAIGILLLFAVALALLNPALTRYVESDRFHAEMEKQTAKGLHFATSHYEPIRRTGLLTAASAGFEANDGTKAIKSIVARDITARFNPLGVFLRRWQLDEVQIGSGEAEIQVYEPKPEPKPQKPWYAIFLPDRVYLERVVCEPADITWLFRNKRAGFFQTRLLITPHGRDFEYDASGGTMKMALIPDQHLRSTHLLITKELLSLYHLDLASGGHEGERVHAEGTAGLKDDKSVDAEIKFAKLPIREWLPSSWRNYLGGSASGKGDWRGRNTKLETSSGNGSVRVDDGRVSNAPFLEKLAAITAKKSLEILNLNECSFDIEWTYPKFNFKDIVIEENGKFRIEGVLQIHGRELGGSLHLGVTPEYLDWLPKADQVFTERRGGYWWTVVHVSGTTKEMHEDLSPRIMEVVKKSPGAYLGLFFRSIGEWIEEVFGNP